MNALIGMNIYTLELLIILKRNKNLDILSNILTMHNWENKIEKRGVAFLLIVAKRAYYIRTTIVTNKNVEWKAFQDILQ